VSEALTRPQVLEERPGNAVDVLETAILVKKTGLDGREAAQIVPLEVRALSLRPRRSLRCAQSRSRNSISHVTLPHAPLHQNSLQLMPPTPWRWQVFTGETGFGFGGQDHTVLLFLLCVSVLRCLLTSCATPSSTAPRMCPSTRTQATP